MSVLDKAKAHFEQIIQDSKLYCIDVPEWGEKVYYKPLEALRSDDVNKILAGDKRGDIHGMIDILIVRALTADGQKMFKQADVDTLRKEVSSLVISDVVSRMSKEEKEDIFSDDTAGKP